MSVDAGFEPSNSETSTETPVFEFGDLDLGDSAQTSVETPANVVPDGQQEQQRENPAWSTLKEKLPKEFHSQVDPILRDWDSGVKRQFEGYKQKYGAFDPLIEQGITPDAITQAMGLVERINTEPLAFFEQMRDLLVQQGLLEEAQEVQEQIDDLEEQQEQTGDPRVDQLQKSFEQFQNGIQQAYVQQQQQEAAARADQSIAEEMAFIESKVGTIPDWAKIEIYNRAAMMSEQQGRNVSLTEAYRDLQNLRQQVLNTPRPGAQAPKVVPGGGGFPAPQRNADALKTADGRMAAGAEIARRMREQQS